MKSTLLHTLAISAAIFAATASVSASVQPFMRSAQQKAPESIQFNVVYEEDFSKFTAGSEANPDKTDLRESEDSYYLNDKYTKQPGWKGNCVYQANGACYIGSYYNSSYGETMYGFISSPATNLAGEVIVSVKAKLPAGAALTDKYGDPLLLNVAICDDYYGPADRGDFELSHDWQTFEFKTDKADFNEPSYLQFTCYDSEVILDDIVIKHAITKIGAPYSLPATNNSLTSFTANWEEAPGAEEYLLTVYYKDIPADAPESGSYSTDFDDINNNNGKIDANNPNLPEGWDISLGKNGTDFATTAGTFNSGKQGLLLDEVGEYILSPVTPAPISHISFWCKPSSMVSEDWSNSSMISVSVLCDKTWMTLGNLNTFYLPDGDFWEMGSVDIYEGATQLKIEYIQKGEGEITFSIDDLKIEYAAQPVPFNIITDLPVKGTSYTIDKYDNTKPHFYTVKSHTGDLYSDPSYPIWVDGLIGLVPEINEPSNINKDGFTISWTDFPNADKYQINVNKLIKAQTNGQEIVLIDENFDGVSAPGGTTDYPVTSYYTESLNEKGFTATDWICQLPAYVDGMAGAQHANYWTGQAGLVVSPRISLNNGDGSFAVSFRAYMTDPTDELFALVLKEHTDQQAIAGYAMPFSGDEAGFFEGTVNFPAASTEFPMDLRKGVKIAFMSKNGQPIFIDSAKISQKFNAGETAVIPFKTLYTDEAFYNFSDLDDADGYSIAVKASATYDYMPYVSDWSAEKIIDLKSSIADITADAAIELNATNGMLEISTPEAVEVEIFNTQGILLTKVVVPAGNSTINCSAYTGQLLIVRAAGKAIKCAM